MNEKKINGSAIQFLAFEGGGGKGSTYLGAIKALEQKGVIKAPSTESLNSKALDVSKTHVLSNTKIQGVSGSSAGAITAFFLAIGLNSKELNDIMTQKSPKNGSISIFDSFTDDWQVLENGEFHRKIRTLIDEETENGKTICSNRWLPNPVTLNLSNEVILIIRLILPKIREKLKEYAVENNEHLLLKIVGATASMAKAGGSNDIPSAGGIPTLDNQFFAQFVINLLEEGGVFSAKSARDYFKTKMNLLLLKKEETLSRFEAWERNEEVQGLIDEVCPKREELHKITFKQFYYLTGVDLRVTGTNITKKIPVYFSVVDTPDFPVIDAICISMNIPILFKPVLIIGTVNRSESKEFNEKYRGLYVDGGMLNNLPLHAFDYWEKGIESPFFNDTVKHIPEKSTNDKPFLLRDEAKLLHANAIAFRLSEPTEIKSYFNQLVGYAPLPIKKYLGELLNTLMAPAEDSQIRYASERNQIIELNTFDLDMMEFGPSAEKLKQPLENALRVTLDRII